MQACGGRRGTRRGNRLVGRSFDRSTFCLHFWRICSRAKVNGLALRPHHSNRDNTRQARCCIVPFVSAAKCGRVFIVGIVTSFLRGCSCTLGLCPRPPGDPRTDVDLLLSVYSARTTHFARAIVHAACKRLAQDRLQRSSVACLHSKCKLDGHCLAFLHSVHAAVCPCRRANRVCELFASSASRLEIRICAHGRPVPSPKRNEARRITYRWRP